ncbi:hypothetical protein MLD38_030671 [Melastoma candidum]|uniref:Uncharacterized protein n=1 Tax=Melastoma candidum TaxID=119954 RepID=A0ACB9MLW1_9MYRT|nr:hypothetical protein MLD38_030671 [Melastoma candidum]
MALARLASRKMLLQPRLLDSSRTLWGKDCGGATITRFMATGGEKVRTETSDGKEVVVKEGDKKKFSLFPRKGNRKWNLWKWRRGDNYDYAPELYAFSPSGLENAIIQATENINRLFQRMSLLPPRLGYRVKEKDDHYKLRFDVPGMTKDDLKIVVHDGVLRIEGEQKKEEEEESEDEYCSVGRYGYYNTTLILPEDAKAGEIQAELKDGVLTIMVPRNEEMPKKDMKEIKINT